MKNFCNKHPATEMKDHSHGFAQYCPECLIEMPAPQLGFEAAVAEIKRRVRSALDDMIRNQSIPNNPMGRMDIERVLMPILLELMPDASQDITVSVITNNDPRIATFGFIPLTLRGCDIMETMFPEQKDDIEAYRRKLRGEVTIELTVQVTEDQTKRAAEVEALETAYLILLSRLAPGGANRMALQGVLADLRDRIAALESRTPEDVQNEFEALALKDPL